MRRAIVMFTVAIFALGASAVMVSAQDQRTPSVNQERGFDAGTPLQASEVKPLGKVPLFTCDRSAGVDRYLRCLHRYLNRLAKNLNRTITQLEKTTAELYHLTVECISGWPVTQYGGYLYGDPAAPFSTTGIDYTEDPATEAFEYHAVIQATCVTP